MKRLRIQPLRALPFFVGVVSFAFFMVLVPLRGQPWLATSDAFWTDHVSHRSAALVFFYRGLEIYNKSPDEALERDARPAGLRPERIDGISGDDFFILPERREPERPVVINWSGFPRVYPPGAWVYAAPGVWAQERFGVAESIANAMTIVQYVAAAHLLIFLLFTIVWRDAWATRSRLVLVACGALALGGAIQTMHWSLNGMYDAVAIVCVVLAVMRSRESRWESGLWFYALGCFLHFRALWYLPLAGLAIVQGFRALRAGYRPSPLGVAQLVGAAFGFAAALYALLLVYPVLSTFPNSNPFHFTDIALSPRWLIVLSLGGGFVAAIREQGRWFRFCVLATAVAFIANAPQVMPWHSLFLLPLLAVAGWERSPREMLAGAGAVALVGWLFFNVSFVDPVTAFGYVSDWNPF